MNDTITVVGNLATPPETKHLPDGTPVTSFRLASSRRKFDTGAGRFVDVDANYYTVSAYREFGQHVAQSLTKGSRVVVTGRLRPTRSDPTSATASRRSAPRSGRLRSEHLPRHRTPGRRRHRAGAIPPRTERSRPLRRPARRGTGVRRPPRRRPRRSDRARSMAHVDSAGCPRACEIPAACIRP